MPSEEAHEGWVSYLDILDDAGHLLATVGFFGDGHAQLSARSEAVDLGHWDARESRTIEVIFDLSGGLATADVGNGPGTLDLTATNSELGALTVELDEGTHLIGQDPREAPAPVVGALTLCPAD